VGAFVQAPPAPFEVETPNGWVRSREAAISWTPAPDAVAGVTYSVYVDGHLRAHGLSVLQTQLDTVAFGDGVHYVQVVATDGAGQRTMSPQSELKIDTDAPIVRVRPIHKGRGVQVSVRDRASGVDAAATRISFGDGRLSARRQSATHIYASAGTYTITAFVRDNAGNSATVHVRVTVR
jgi:hypothetical protein